jgi:CheY-like chemotaxis protein
MPKYKRYIFIDDSALILKFCKSIIEKRKVEIIELRDGEEALEWFQAHEDMKDTFVLLDIKMPNMDGFEFLDSIKSMPLHSSVHIHIYSGNIPERIKKAQDYALVKSYLIKPQKPETMVALFQ